MLDSCGVAMSGYAPSIIWSQVVPLLGAPKRKATFMVRGVTLPAIRNRNSAIRRAARCGPHRSRGDIARRGWLCGSHGMCLHSSDQHSGIAIRIHQARETHKLGHKYLGDMTLAAANRELRPVFGRRSPILA